MLSPSPRPFAPRVKPVVRARGPWRPLVTVRYTAAVARSRGFDRGLRQRCAAALARSRERARALRRLRGPPPPPTRQRAAASAAGGDQLADVFAQRGGFFLRAADGGLGRGGPDSSTAGAPKGDLDARGLVPRART